MGVSSYLKGVIGDDSSHTTETSGLPYFARAQVIPDSGWWHRGVLVAHLQEHPSAVNDKSVSTDLTFFVTASDDSTVKVWDSRKLEKDSSFRSRLTYCLDGSRALCAIMLHGSAQVVIGASDGYHSSDGYKVFVSSFGSDLFDTEGASVNYSWFNMQGLVSLLKIFSSISQRLSTKYIEFLISGEQGQSVHMDAISFSRGKCHLISEGTLLTVKKKKETKAMVFYQMDTEEVSDRFMAPCFVNGLEAYDGEINLGVEENMISNEYAVKLCLEHEVRRGNKVVKKELIVALRVNVEEYNNIQAKDVQFDAYEFINPFATTVTKVGQSSSRHIDLSNMHQFYQRHPSEYQWTRVNPLEKVLRDPTKHVQTRWKLATNAELCMFAPTVSKTESKNIKEAMAYHERIEAMPSEIHQFERLDVWKLVDKPFEKNLRDTYRRRELTLKSHSHQLLDWKILIDPEHPEKVYRLKKALYGLKQAPRALYDELFKFLSKYALKILKKHGMDKYDTIGTTMATKPELDADLSGTLTDQTKYHSMIGLLMYLTASRSELMHATCFCARYQARPTEKHLKEERIADFVPIGSEEDERLIQKMNKKVTGVHEEKILKEPDSTKFEVKQEGNKENTRKRPGRRLKMKATKESRMQKIDSDLEEEEHLKTFLKLVPDEKGIIDYEVLEKRFPIINWESKFYHLDRHGAECIYYRIFRSDE
ncbi:retrovirus-related pol polyprotein from transposon TNT 1-94, partial [Tanacetum coccineum]